jgi:hypothetical protein
MAPPATAQGATVNDYAEEQKAKRRAQGLCDRYPFGWDDWCQLPLGHAGDHADYQDLEERQQRLAVDIVHTTLRAEGAAAERVRIVAELRANGARVLADALPDDSRATVLDVETLAEALADRIERGGP